mmetsp:Transcript_65566/g.181483  ORF Transcript_65566/g.181483 Transcript_65566/m.181483 type:complete len:179 (-) Transcript_65566:612-1148(-)
MDDTVEQQERRAQEVAERLVQNVARAFYDDDTVAVFDALVNHKYLKEPSGRKTKLSEEQAAAVEAGQAEPFGRPLDEVLQLRPKQVRKLMENLTRNERLVRKEDIGNDGSFFYIDYNWFKGVMDFRVGLMKRILKEMDSASKVECGTLLSAHTTTTHPHRPSRSPLGANVLPVSAVLQ